MAERREAALRSAFRQTGVDALELSTDDDLVDAVLRFADLRKRRQQLAGGGALPRHLEPGVPPGATLRPGATPRAAAV
jgi:hypothetical protein